MNIKEVQKSFVEKYRNEIFPYLKGHEVLRKRIIEKWKTIAYPTVILCFFAYFVIAIQTFLNFDIGAEWRFYYIVFAPIIYAIVIYFIFDYKNKKNKKFRMDLKEKCLPILLESFGKIQWLNSKNRARISDADLKTSQLFARYNIRTNDDQFSGEYNGVQFKVSETKLIYESGSGKNRTCINIFNGIILKFKFDEKNYSRTMISTKGDLTARDNRWLALLGITLPSLEMFKGYFKSGDPADLILPLIILCGFLIFGAFIYFKCLKDDDKLGIEKNQKIILEDIKFNKKFHVYALDQIEARCIATPSFMEKFLNLKTAYGAKNAKCAFYGNTVMFAITTKENLFEIGDLNKTLLDPQSLKKLYNEISAIYEIIDYFKLGK